MFKLALFAALVAVAVAYPGGHTGYVITEHGHEIHAPNVLSVAHDHPHIEVAHQHAAPVVHKLPIVTKTVVTHHDFGHGHGLSLH